AQTREGQVLAGDALYLRDVAAPGYEVRWSANFPAEKLLKMVCLFEVFGLSDCAAELLVMKEKELNDMVDVTYLLDVLASELHPKLKTLTEVNRRFDASRDFFYPHGVRQRLGRILPGP